MQVEYYGQYNEYYFGCNFSVSCGTLAVQHHPPHKILGVRFSIRCFHIVTLRLTRAIKTDIQFSIRGFCFSLIPGLN